MSEALRKYGRTPHLSFSPGATRDDRVIADLASLLSLAEIVVTEKMDGENTTIHAGGCHPRSPDARDHVSRDWIKGFAAGVSQMLAPDERIVGEYLFARHSVSYSNLPSFFLGFAWMTGSRIRGWDETLDRFASLGVLPVPELYRGPPSEAVLEQLAKNLDTDTQEGFVVRSIASFPEDDMQVYLAKWVREGHVQSETHWMNGPLVQNGLAK